jgi:hypothetical protein
MAATYQWDKILHCVQNDKGLSYHILILPNTYDIDTGRTRQKARQALTFCRQKGYNTKYCILIDMSLPSVIRRFITEFAFTAPGSFSPSISCPMTTKLYCMLFLYSASLWCLWRKTEGLDPAMS